MEASAPAVPGRRGGGGRPLAAVAVAAVNARSRQSPSRPWTLPRGRPPRSGYGGQGAACDLCGLRSLEGTDEIMCDIVARGPAEAWG
ncbi:hypothetical protein JCM4814A_33280 [Streptomyces phaeofaciens JCM 4814]|uniref:Uncharacterized protein n=1 Tax=Streptomyces phaeofaciens TaxID=68254 RepID=A0A918HK30_9ACTN|nr:hypothetical protein GCM10010226_59120 [Streptomyces phaeofaciens]